MYMNRLYAIHEKRIYGGFRKNSMTNGKIDKTTNQEFEILKRRKSEHWIHDAEMNSELNALERNLYGWRRKKIVRLEIFRNQGFRAFNRDNG